MSNTLTWKVRERKYEAEKRSKSLPREETLSHPLKGITVLVSETKGHKTDKSSRSSSVDSQSVASFVDPFSNSLEGTDPLSMFAAEAAAPRSKTSAAGSDTKSGSSLPSDADLSDRFEPWLEKKVAILSKYTTSEKLSITTSFLGETEKVTVKSPSGTVSDKVKNRLEQLDDFEEGSVQEMLNLSQQEYVKRIEELSSALITAWNQDQRVRSLKIAIQCSKMLTEVSVIHFYPSKFVLVTDILDTFGRLVFERIKNKATYLPKGSQKPIQLPDDFTPEQVPESAKETCRNWFFKIASIRELVPRFYVEAAILKCYGFLTSGEYNKALLRLGLMTRGIGDPLVSLYSRCYLCRVGIQVAPSIRDHLMPAFDDFLFSHKQIQGDDVQRILSSQKLDLPRYLTLYSPGLDWVLQCVSHGAADTTLEQVLHKCQAEGNSALLLNSILSSFKPQFISSRAMKVTEMIKECEDTGFPKYLMYRSLGVCLAVADPPEEDKLSILNDVWKVVVKMKHPTEYMACAEVWIEYVVKNFGKREVNTILGDIIKHMMPDRAFEDHYPHLQAVVSKIVNYMHDFSLLFALEKFQPFLDMFQKEAVKVDVCKTILESYCRYQTETTSDPIIINALMFSCKIMHDSVNALTLEDDIRHIGYLINTFIRSIHFGRDFENQLNFYVESRASFSNIDAVIVFLVQCVNTLAIQTRKIVKGNHTRKTAAFVRACAAYCYITIPSLNSIFSRLNLYLVSGQVALSNLCLSQADAFFKAAVSVLPEVPRTLEMDGKIRNTELFVLEYINNLTSALLVVPDNTDQGVLYLVRGLLNVVTDYSWDHHSNTMVTILMNIIVMLSAMCQEVYPYSIDKVDSNDKLYGHDPKFVKECTRLTLTLLQDVLNCLGKLDSVELYRRQASVSHEMFSRVLAHGDLRDPEMYSLAVRLWSLGQKHGQMDTKLSVRTLNYVKQCASQSLEMKKLASELGLQSRT